MTFLAPWLLALAAGAAVPLLLHLLRRRGGARVEFPAARYLLRAEQDHRRTLRLRNLLLMLLRVAAVLLIALAAARPLAAWLGGRHAPTALAIVVDNSLSAAAVANGRPVLDGLRDAAVGILDAATAADRLWIVTAEGTVHGGSPAQLRGVVAQLEPYAGSRDLRAAIGRASGLAAAAVLPNRQVALLTDGQRSEWTAESPTPTPPVVALMPAELPPTNRGVMSATPRPSRWSPRGAIVVRLHGPDSGSYRVTLEGRTVARGSAARGEEIVVPTVPAERGWVRGTVETEPDELMLDNVRHFSTWVGLAPTASATATAGEFVTSALDVMRGSGTVASGGGVTIGPADEVNRLPALLTAPRDFVRLGAANRNLQRLGIPWRFGERRAETATATGAEIDDVQVTDRYELVPLPGAEGDTLARAGGAPWIIAGPRFVIVASPLDAAATSMPVRAAFIPWLTAVVTDRLGSDDGRALAATPGARVAVPRGVDALEGADGARITVTDTARAPTSPGVWFLLSGARRVGTLVVNVDSSESELARLTPSQLAGRLGVSAGKVHLTTTALTQAVFAAGRERSIIGPLIAAALALLLVEGLVVASQRRVAG